MITWLKSLVGKMATKELVETGPAAIAEAWPPTERASLEAYPRPDPPLTIGQTVALQRRILRRAATAVFERRICCCRALIDACYEAKAEYLHNELNNLFVSIFKPEGDHGFWWVVPTEEAQNERALALLLLREML